MSQLLQNKGGYEIITPKQELCEQYRRIEKAGRTCYQSVKKEITEKSAKKFIKMLLSRGHESVIEHSCLTVQFNNISRGFTHEMVRHRLASYSQESTRYVDYSKEGGDVDIEKASLKCIIPPHKSSKDKIKLSNDKEITVQEMFDNVEKYYKALRKAGWAPEDARQILPIGIKSQLVVTANFRQWRHIFAMRTHQTAHWEIRQVLSDLLLEMQAILPIIFDDFKQAGQDIRGVKYFVKK